MPVLLALNSSLWIRKKLRLKAPGTGRRRFRAACVTFRGVHSNNSGCARHVLQASSGRRVLGAGNGLQQTETTGRDATLATRLALSADSPEALMVGYQAGNAVAATALIRRVSPMLYRLFAAEVASRANADDLLQETWLRIHRVRHTYRPSEPVLPWLYAIARHVRIDHYRTVRRSRVREQGIAEVSEIAAESLEPGASDDLDSLLEPLSASEREAIELLKIVGMSLEEVAGATSCSVGSVKQKVHRAYKKLRIRLREMKVKVAKPNRGALS